MTSCSSAGNKDKRGSLFSTKTTDTEETVRQIWMYRMLRQRVTKEVENGRMEEIGVSATDSYLVNNIDHDLAGKMSAFHVSCFSACSSRCHVAVEVRLCILFSYLAGPLSHPPLLIPRPLNPTHGLSTASFAFASADNIPMIDNLVSASDLPAIRGMMTPTTFSLIQPPLS